MYADEGVSGKASVRRPAFERMIGDVLGDGVTHIVALKLDRLCRSATRLLDLYDRLERKGVAIVTIDDGIDTGTAQGRLFRTILAGVAEFERDLASERTRNGLAAARDAGKALGRAPYGSRHEGGRLVEFPEQQRLLERVRAMHNARESYASIARTLNAEGVTPPRGARWHATSIRHVLGHAKAARASASV